MHWFAITEYNVFVNYAHKLDQKSQQLNQNVLNFIEKDANRNFKPKYYENINKEHFKCIDFILFSFFFLNFRPNSNPLVVFCPYTNFRICVDRGPWPDTNILKIVYKLFV